MKRSLLKYLFFIGALAVPLFTMAQADIHFSQFYEMSILRNPALTGVFQDDYKIGVNYRNQWSSISNPFQTGLINAEARFPVSQSSNDFISAGLLGYYDKAGSIDQKIEAFYPAINYNKCLDPDKNTYLSAGFTGGYLQYSFDPSKATFNNQYVNGSYSQSNPTGENLPKPTLGVWDMGAGVNFNTTGGKDKRTTYILGVSGYHFTQPDNSYYKDPDIRLSMRWNVNAAISTQVTEAFSYQFQANVAIQGNYQEIIGGGMVGWNTYMNGASPEFAIFAGLFYRYGDALIPTLKLKYKDLSFGFSYDVNLSTLKAATNTYGAYEVTLSKSGLFPHKETGKANTMCPRF